MGRLSSGKNKTDAEYFQIFLDKSKALHGDLFDYSKAVYVGTDHCMTIVCPVHGDFKQRPGHHSVRGQGCPKCKAARISKGNTQTTEAFIKKAKLAHGDKYDYSKVDYRGIKYKVIIICPEHGEFSQMPQPHYARKRGCLKCVKRVIKARNKVYHHSRLPVEKFIEKARKIHGDRCDYSEVDYKGATTRVIIRCIKHDEKFTQMPTSHYTQHVGCKSCKKETFRKSNFKSFVKRSTERHNGYYDYSEVKFVDPNTKVKIICPEHGSFMQTARKHVEGSKCLKCSQLLSNDEALSRVKERYGDEFDYSLFKYDGQDRDVTIGCSRHGFFDKRYRDVMRYTTPCIDCYRRDTEEFIGIARDVHGDKYDYSKVEYKLGSEKVIVICPEHGEFLVRPALHIGRSNSNGGTGCHACFLNSIRKPQWKFIEEARDKHGDEFDYSKVEYTGSNRHVTIGCRVHGYFDQTPANHLMGKGCQKCDYRRRASTTAEFIEKAMKVHGELYDYSLVRYVNTVTKVKIICKRCCRGFDQAPHVHLQHHGCKICNAVYSTEIQKRESLNKPALLYYIKITDLDGTQYWKIGFTTKNSLRLRFIKAEMENFEVQWIKPYATGHEAFHVEQVILNKFQFYRAYNKNVEVLINGGWTELFTKDVLSNIKVKWGGVI